MGGLVHRQGVYDYNYVKLHLHCTANGCVDSVVTFPVERVCEIEPIIASLANACVKFELTFAPRNDCCEVELLLHKTCVLCQLSPLMRNVGFPRRVISKVLTGHSSASASFFLSLEAREPLS